jgi:CRP-like cAMP-binding protein
VHAKGQWPPRTFLGWLPDTIRAELLRLGTVVQFDTGRFLLREGEESTHVLLLLTGWVKITASTEGGHVTLLGLRFGGDLIGELASLGERNRSASAVAGCHVEACVLPWQTFQSFLAGHADASLAVSRAVGVKLYWANRRRIDMGAHEVPVRLARVLIELAEASGVWTVPLTQAELAALTGASEPAVHKAITELRRRGVLATGYGRTIITDVPQLRTVAGL